jgi:hypothetical protein
MLYEKPIVPLAATYIPGDHEKWLPSTPIQSARWRKWGVLCKYIIRTETKISQIMPGWAEISFLLQGVQKKISVVSGIARFFVMKNLSDLG